MKKITTVALMLITGTCALAQEKTDKEIRQQILLERKQSKGKIKRPTDFGTECTDIVIEKNELEDTKSYLPPHVLLYSSNVLMYREKKGQADQKWISFKAYVYSCSYREKGLYVKLSSGEILKFPENDVSCRFSTTSYCLTSYMLVTPEIEQKLLENDIVEFSISGTMGYLGYKHPEAYKPLIACMFGNDL